MDYITEVKNRQIEQEASQPKIDLKILKNRSSGKTAKGIVLGYLKKLKQSDAPFEYLKVLESLYKEVADLETSQSFRAKQWRGKSGVKFIRYPDKVISIRFRKSTPEETPKEVKAELLKEDINQVIFSINKLDNGEWIKTRDIAEEVFHDEWGKVFSNRNKHPYLCEILNFLEYCGWINYSRSGKSKVVGKLEKQESLLTLEVTQKEHSSNLIASSGEKEVMINLRESNLNI